MALKYSIRGVPDSLRVRFRVVHALAGSLGISIYCMEMTSKEFGILARILENGSGLLQ